MKWFCCVLGYIICWQHRELPWTDISAVGQRPSPDWISNSARSAPHYCDVMMGAMASQITSLMIVCSSVYSGTDQRKHHSSASLASVWGIHRWPVNYPHKGLVTRKMFPFNDVIMYFEPTRLAGDAKSDFWNSIVMQLEIFEAICLQPQQF